MPEHVGESVNCQHPWRTRDDSSAAASTCGISYCCTDELKPWRSYCTSSLAFHVFHIWTLLLLPFWQQSQPSFGHGDKPEPSQRHYGLDRYTPQLIGHLLHGRLGTMTYAGDLDIYISLVGFVCTTFASFGFLPWFCGLRDRCHNLLPHSGITHWRRDGMKITLTDLRTNNSTRILLDTAAWCVELQKQTTESKAWRDFDAPPGPLKNLGNALWSCLPLLVR